MRRLLFSALLMSLLISGLAAEFIPVEGTDVENTYYNDDFLWFESPEFMQPMFDSFSRNRLNTKAMGRGHIGIPVCEGIENATLNPAGFKVNSKDTYIEISFKPEVEDYSDYYNYSKENIDGNIVEEYALTTENRNTKMGSAYPSGIISYGRKLGRSGNIAFSFSIPQSLDLNNFAHVSHAGEVYDFDTSFRKFDLTLSANYAMPVEGLTLGLNSILNIVDIQTERLHFNYGHDGDNVTYFSIMPGFLYKKGMFTLGATYKTGTEQDFDMGYGGKYTVTIPAIIGAGVAIETQKITILGEMNYEKTSEMNSEFDDRMILKAGLEKTKDKTTFRVGLISMPEVFSGDYNLPMCDQTQYHSADWSNEYNFGSIISNNTTFLTGGLTYSADAFDLNAAFSADLGDTGSSQFSLSGTIKYDKFKEIFSK